MISWRRALVNPLPLVLLGACEAPPERGVAPYVASVVELAPQVGPTRHGIVGAGPGRLVAPRLRDLELPPRAALDDDSILLKLASPLDDASYVDDGGEAIDEALEGFSRAVIEEYGAGLLSAVQLFGDPFHAPICDPAELRANLVDADGERWEASLEVPQFQAFVGDLEVSTSAVSEECVAGVGAAAGDVAAAVSADACSEAEQHQFFEDGGSCQVCVAANGGDVAACTDAGDCASEAPDVTWVYEGEEKAWYQLAQGTAWACRPDWLALVYVLAHIPADGALPQSYDHANWNYYCFPIYDPATDSVQYTCDAGDSPELGHTLSEGLSGRTSWMKNEKGELRFGNRQYYSPRVDLDTGAWLRWSWANSSNLGRLSKPVVLEDTNGDGVLGVGDDGYGYASDGWGINPHALRPGGVDPQSLDDTFARDWFALLALKTATTMDGVSVSMFNHNRCARWEGTGEDGRDRCLEPVSPDGAWLNDALNYGLTLDDGQLYDYPLPVATIGSTGLPDPDVPGGIVPLIAGSERLAEPGWEACTWPNSFVTDLIPYPDTPWDYTGPASVWGDTYRFGKDAELDLRMVVSTNLARHYCPEAP